MIEIDIRGFDAVQRQLGALAKEQIPFAAMVALNGTAFKVKTALQKEMLSVFNKPTPWLMRQITVAKATKNDLTAIVGTLEGKKKGFRKFSTGIFERILSPHIVGGSRQQRQAELRLSRAGILPYGWVAVPSPAAPLDAYGNLSGAWWVMILSWLNALNWSSQGSTQNRAEKISGRKNKLEQAGIELFAAIPGRMKTRHLKPGIYMRKKRKGYDVINALLLFVNATNYQARLDWYGVTYMTVEKELPSEMSRAINLAIDTAR